MRVKLASLICAANAIAVVWASSACAAANNNDAALGPAKPLLDVEMIVAQAWWDAASNAATAQQHAVTRQVVPFIRNTNQRGRHPHR
jgi:hypothetical protein